MVIARFPNNVVWEVEGVSVGDWKFHLAQADTAKKSAAARIDKAAAKAAAQTLRRPAAAAARSKNIAIVKPGETDVDLSEPLDWQIDDGKISTRFLECEKLVSLKVNGKQKAQCSYRKARNDKLLAMKAVNVLAGKLQSGDIPIDDILTERDAVINDVVDRRTR